AEMGRRDGSEAVNAVLFNGAAISRSRKCVLTPQQGASAIHLQWGRDLSIAEILHCSAFNLIGSGSSMGPRSLDRGNMAWDHTTGIIGRIQWGRDLSIAEI